MAERKSSSSSGSGKASGASEVEAGAPEPRRARKPKKVEIHVGGHVILADPPPDTPEPIERCSVCGQDPATCPHGDTEGWKVED